MYPEDMNLSFRASIPFVSTDGIMRLFQNDSQGPVCGIVTVTVSLLFCVQGCNVFSYSLHFRLVVYLFVSTFN